MVWAPSLVSAKGNHVRGPEPTQEIIASWKLSYPKQNVAVMTSSRTIVADVNKVLLELAEHQVKHLDMKELYMTTHNAKLWGPVNRVDGSAKVSGQARYCGAYERSHP